MNIGKISLFASKWVHEYKKLFNRMEETTSWNLFILHLCEMFCEQHELPEDLKKRYNFYLEHPYNPEYYPISEKSFQESLKENWSQPETTGSTQ